MNLPEHPVLPQSPASFREKTTLFISNYYPLLLAILLQQVLLFLATLGLPYSIFNAADFARSDSGLYFDIARNGYELFPCHERFSTYASNSPDWCGNAGWMPLYAYILKPLMFIGITQEVAGYWVSRICYLGVLYFIFSICRKFSKTTCLLTMLLAAMFPSSVYYAASFPISLMLALLFGSFYFWKKQRFILANLFAFLIPLSYSTGFLSMVPWSIFILILYFRKRELFLKTIPIVVSIALGYLTFFMIQELSTGHWNAFFMIQRKYGHGFHEIVQPIWDMIKSIWLSGLNNNWQNIQSLTFIVLLLVVSIRSFFEKDLDTLFANLFFVVYAAFPLLIGGNMLAQYRSEALLLPLVIFLGQHKKMGLVLIPVFLYLFFCCTIDFFNYKIE